MNLGYVELKKNLILLVVCLLSSLSLFAEIQTESAYKPGERLTYKAFYNWGLIWVYAADVDFEISQKIFSNYSALCFESKASSIPRYDWFFRVRDSFKSYATADDFSPLFAERKTSEGNLRIYESYTFQHGTNKIYSTLQSSNKTPIKDTISLKSGAYDVLSAVYNARNLDFDRYKLNDKIPVKIVLDGKIHSLFVRYLGKEVVKTRKNQSFKCHKFSSFMVAGTAFKGGEDVTVWVTDDQNRMPVLVEAKVLIGSVKAYLDTFEGLKFPIKAIVK
jgi:hypothetical protein